MMDYLIMDLVSFVEKSRNFLKQGCYGNKYAMGEQIPSWQNILEARSQPCSGSDEAVKRKTLGSLKIARRQN